MSRKYAQDWARRTCAGARCGTLVSQSSREWAGLLFGADFRADVSGLGGCWEQIFDVGWVVGESRFQGGAACAELCGHGGPPSHGRAAGRKPSTLNP